ncbi:hypothetical protein [Streptomyces flavidovirens]|uniref:hypothetical protein n=1 Tax=Streptomyces flavidovirens TaxID=67298 RepID=UPI003681F60C
MAWHANSDALAALDGDERAPWVRYTRNPPPLYDWEHIGTDAVSAYTPEEQTMSTAIHEAAHAVVYMAAGYRIGHIALHEPEDHSHGGRAHVNYLPASGPWLDWAVTCAAGERAEDRWMRENGLWTPDRAWVSERLAWRDRSQLGSAYRDGSGKDLTFHGTHSDPGDYAWVMDRTDESLDPVWSNVLQLAHHVVEHRRIDGDEAAKVAGLHTINLAA